MKWALCLLAAFACLALAADISGNWKGTADFGGNPVERTFTFKVDGAKLTGETNSQMLGKSTIENGKIEGDTVTFSITAKFQDQEMKINYKGKVNAKGDEMKLTSETPNGNIEWTVKKQ